MRGPAKARSTSNISNRGKDRGRALSSSVKSQNFHINSLSTASNFRYIAFLAAVGDHWRRLHRDPTHLRDIFLQHDNARPHTSSESQEFLQRRSVRLIYQSPYSPDFNLCDRWLFSALKCQIKKMNFETHDEVKQAATQAFSTIPQERFTTELEKLKIHLNRVIQSGGEYCV